MSDMFFIVAEPDIASYADESTPYSGDKTTENVMLNLERLSKYLLLLFYLNQIRGNPDKCHLLLSTSEKVIMNIQDLNIINTKSEKLLGITIGLCFISNRFIGN